jgi:hypothetical protein
VITEKMRRAKLVKGNPNAAQIRRKFHAGSHTVECDDNAFFVLELHAATAADQRAADSNRGIVAFEIAQLMQI